MPYCHGKQVIHAGDHGALWGWEGPGAAPERLLQALPKASSLFLHVRMVSLDVAHRHRARYGLCEGYKAFRRPFLAHCARARYLRTNPRVVHIILAPFFCMGYFHATKRRKITSISLTLGIIVLIVLVGFVSQPCEDHRRGGRCGLAWGVISLLLFGFQALGAVSYPIHPRFPMAETEPVSAAICGTSGPRTLVSS